MLRRSCLGQQAIDVNLEDKKFGNHKGAKEVMEQIRRKLTLGKI
jgi:hypothetical protein